MDLNEISYPPSSTLRKLTFAFALSIGLHLVLVWYLSDWHQTEWDDFPSPALQRPLNITITPPRAPVSKRPQAPLPEQATDQSAKIRPQPKKKPNDTAEATTSKQTLSSTRERAVSTAQIKQSAAAVIRALTDDDEGEQEQRQDRVSTILERALNKPREKPGIRSLADGTTRIVTEQGYTYCIKPLDDWRIIDPQDDIRTSVYCN
jgi:hypothetical protein